MARYSDNKENTKKIEDPTRFRLKHLILILTLKTNSELS